MADAEVEDKMEVTEQSTPVQVPVESVKRIYVNADGEETGKGKRQKIDGMTVKNKGNAIKYAKTLTMEVCVQTKVPPIALEHFVSSTTLFAVAFRIHQYIRGTNTNTISARTNKVKENSQSFTIEGKQYSITATEMKKYMGCSNQKVA